MIVPMAIPAVEQLTPATVLAELAACDRAEKAAAARRLELAVRWAELHPAITHQPYDKVTNSLLDEQTSTTVEAIAEFAAVHGISTHAGRQLIGDAVTVHTRLPRCWQQLTNLKLPAWKARLLAQTTHHLADQTVAWIDRHAAPLGAKLGVRTIKRLAMTAIARYEPDRLTDANARRWIRISADTDTTDGASWIDGRLDTPDALDLDAALQLITNDLGTEDAGDDRDLRRAHALGIMARRTLGQPELPTHQPRSNTNQNGTDVRPDPPADIHPTSTDTPTRHAGRTPAPTATGDRPLPGPRGQRGRPVSLYVHLDATQLATCDGLGEVGSTGQHVTIDQIRTWCGTAATITIRPVIDLNHTRTTHSYQPTDLMREHLALRDKTCVFPHCTRPVHPARQSRTGEYSHDADHIIPYDSGGKTTTDNLACLCRLHHLLKTHTRWRYEMIGPGEYLWTSPHKQQFLRTDSGTTMLTSIRLRSG